MIFCLLQQQECVEFICVAIGGLQNFYYSYYDMYQNKHSYFKIYAQV